MKQFYLRFHSLDVSKLQCKIESADAVALLEDTLYVSKSSQGPPFSTYLIGTIRRLRTKE